MNRFDPFNKQNSWVEPQCGGTTGTSANLTCLPLRRVVVEFTSADDTLTRYTYVFVCLCLSLSLSRIYIYYAAQVLFANPWNTNFLYWWPFVGAEEATADGLHASALFRWRLHL